MPTTNEPLATGRFREAAQQVRNLQRLWVTDEAEDVVPPPVVTTRVGNVTRRGGFVDRTNMPDDTDEEVFRTQVEVEIPATPTQPTTRNGDIRSNDMQVNYILKEDGFHRETRNTDFIGTYDQLIADMSEDTGQFIKNVGIFAGNRVHMFATPNKIVMCTKVGFLNFNTYFTLYSGNDGVERLIPVFSSSYASLTIKRDVIWRIPEEAPTYFIKVFPKISANRNHYTCYLVSKLNGELRKLFIPNVHSDGKICMGSVWRPETYCSMPLLEQFAKSFNHFYNSGWNRDLYEEYMHGCILFDEEFNQVRTQFNLEEYMPTISNANFEILRHVD